MKKLLALFATLTLCLAAQSDEVMVWEGLCFETPSGFVTTKESKTHYVGRASGLTISITGQSTTAALTAAQRSEMRSVTAQNLDFASTGQAVVIRNGQIEIEYALFSGSASAIIATIEDLAASRCYVAVIYYADGADVVAHSMLESIIKKE